MSGLRVKTEGGHEFTIPPEVEAKGGKAMDEYIAEQSKKKAPKSGKSSKATPTQE